MGDCKADEYLVGDDCIAISLDYVFGALGYLSAGEFEKLFKNEAKDFEKLLETETSAACSTIIFRGLRLLRKGYVWIVLV